MAVIETKNLTYTYPGGTKASISDVSIKVEKGEFVLITGPSGCGKTTLLRIIAGLEIADHGNIAFSGSGGVGFNSASDRRLKENVKLITDAGLTEFNGVPTKTCLALGPDYPENIDPITGNLKLL